MPEALALIFELKQKFGILSLGVEITAGGGGPGGGVTTLVTVKVKVEV